MQALKFSIERKIEGNLGRAGSIETPHGMIETPAFVPVGTKGAMKALTPEQLEECGAEATLANTYHLYLQPGSEIVRNAGGLHKFEHWNKPMMTDSGGFQVFSLGAAYGKNISKLVTRQQEEEMKLEQRVDDPKERAKLVSIDHDGVMFRSHINGDSHYFTPEKSIDIQHDLGADIIFAFDECTSPTEPFAYQRQAMDRTHRWAKKSLEHHQKLEKKKTSALPQAIFGIVQGGREESLRKESAAVIGGMDFDGFGIGVSFAKEDMSTAVAWVNAILPEEKPRHLLGIGEPEDLFMAVENGCDLFDCVAPTRIGRNGTFYTSHGKINILNAQFTSDFTPIEEGCECYTCMNFSKAYVGHLFRAKELLANTLGSIHNLHFIIHLVKKMREAILVGSFEQYKRNFLSKYLQ
jgi:queuine tRNA-ribosyltransferase